MMENCEVFDGSINPGGGYGRVYMGQRDGRSVHVGAHRVAWEKVNGPIPDGMQVLHKCDNPPCVNEDHLFLGTHRDNMIDMTEKGRGNGPPATHGSLGMYSNHGCRCDACRTENIRYQREHRKKKRVA